MKRNILLTSVFLTVYFVLGLRYSFAEQTDKHLIPNEFVSIAEAEKYVSESFAGGRALNLTVENSQVLVINIYGSGVPDIAFAAYTLFEGRWVLASELFPGKTGKITEPHEVIIVGNEIVVVGAQSGQKWVLFRVNDNRR